MANDIITQAMEKAVELRTEKESLYKTISANRSFLRSADESGLLSEAQSTWLTEFYPPKAPRNGDEAE